MKRRPNTLDLSQVATSGAFSRVSLNSDQLSDFSAQHIPGDDDRKVMTRQGSPNVYLLERQAAGHTTFVTPRSKAASLIVLAGQVSVNRHDQHVFGQNAFVGLDADTEHEVVLADDTVAFLIAGHAIDFAQQQK